MIKSYTILPGYALSSFKSRLCPHNETQCLIRVRIECTLSSSEIATTEFGE